MTKRLLRKYKHPVRAVACEAGKREVLRVGLGLRLRSSKVSNKNQ